MSASVNGAKIVSVLERIMPVNYRRLLAALTGRD
jgi:hypothetical protein